MEGSDEPNVMGLQETLRDWGRRTMMRKVLEVLTTALLTASLATGALYLTGFPLLTAVAVAVPLSVPSAYVAARRFPPDPLEWLRRSSPEAADELRTAEEFYGSTGPVVRRLRREADEVSGSTTFSSFAPPLPVRRLAALLLVAALFAGFAQAPQELRDDVRDAVPGVTGGDDVGVAVPGGGNGGDGDGEPGADEGGAPGGEEGELELGEPSEVAIGDQRVEVRVYPSLGSEREGEAEPGGDFLESSGYPPESERSESFADSLPERHREAVIRYFRSMVG